MVDPIEGLNKIVTKKPNPLSDFTTGGKAASGSIFEGKDIVDFNSEALVDTVRQQTNVLKRELPSIIAEALIAPVENQAVRSQPLNSLLFRLKNPLEGVLGALPHEELTEELVQKLQEELNKFKIALPALKDDAILAQFNVQSPSDPLNEILSSLSGQVGSLSEQLDQLL